MSRYLMTHSLLSSWLYAIKENPYEQGGGDGKEEKQTAFDSFLQTLNRVRTEPNEHMQKGIDFENLVTDIIQGRPGAAEHKWYQPASKAAAIIGGGLLQHRAQKEIEVRGITLLLYGRIDALKAGVVYDTKFSGSYEVGKYLDNTQHPMYLEIIPQATRFEYLVSNGSHFWPEVYTREETPSIIPIISQFLDWLDLQNLMGVYKEKWLAK